MKISCLIIDDEPLAASLIKGYVEKILYLQCHGVFYNPLDAMQVLQNEKIDLIFLDVCMPDISGIDFLKGLKDPPRVIFTSAHDKFAIDGFDLNAVDYLVKPVPFNRFLQSCERAMSEIKGKRSPLNDFIFVRSNRDTIKVSLDSIYFVEGYKDYLKIHTDKQHPILTLTTIKAIEELLPDTFLRVHRSYIIAIDKIVSFRSGKVYVKDRHIPISESFTEAFNRNVIEKRLG